MSRAARAEDAKALENWQPLASKLGKPELAQEPSIDLTCAICLDLMREAVVLVACGHSFCLACIDACSASSGDGEPLKCPNCRVAFSGHSPNISLRCMIDAQKVKCPHAGCGEIVAHGLFLDHASKCPYALHRCLLSSSGDPSLVCGAVAKGKDRIEHRKTCPFASAVSCADCGTDLHPKDMDAHSDVCPSRVTSCTHCGMQIMAKFLHAHSCMQEVQCALCQRGVKGSQHAKHLEAHVRSLKRHLTTTKERLVKQKQAGKRQQKKLKKSVTKLKRQLRKQGRQLKEQGNATKQVLAYILNRHQVSTSQVSELRQLQLQLMDSRMPKKEEVKSELQELSICPSEYEPANPSYSDSEPDSDQADEDCYSTDPYFSDCDESGDDSNDRAVEDIEDVYRSNREAMNRQQAREDLGDKRRISIRVTNPLVRGGDVKILISRTAPLRKLMHRYYQAKQISAGQASCLRWIYDGKQLLGDGTPTDYDIEDEAQLDIVTYADI